MAVYRPGSIVRRGAEIYLAALALLLLAQFHGEIVRDALLIAGLRADAPAIAAATFHSSFASVRPCGHHRVEIGWLENQQGLVACADKVDVTAIVPSNSPVVLDVNDAPRQSVTDSGPLVRFTNIALRPGENLISLKRADQRAEVEQRRFDGSWRPTAYGQIPELEAKAFIRIQRPTGTGPPRRLQQWLTPQGVVALWQFDPDASAKIETEKAFTVFDTAGLALARQEGPPLGPTPHPPPPSAPATAPVYRKIEITRDAEGLVRVNGQLCLPPGSLLVQWAAAGQISGPELLDRTAGLAVRSRNAARTDESVTVRTEAAGCLPVTFTYAVPQGYLEQAYSGWSSFLGLPGDSLTLTGFAAGVVSLPPSTVHQGTMQWNGPTLPIADSNVELRVRDQPPGQEDEALGGPRAEVEPERGDVAAALSDAFDQFPEWLKTSLWGLAAAIPSLAVWLTLRNDPSLAQQTRGIQVGLMALLVLLLAVTAQPLLSATALWLARTLDIGLFFEYATGPGVHFIGGPILYAPVAMAASLLMLPTLRAPIAPSARRISLAPRALAAIISVGALPGGIAVLVAQRLPWLHANHQDADLMSALARLGLVTDSRQVLILSTAWVGASGVLSWAVVYWLFRAAVPRGRVAGAALVAALVIFYLPLTPYCAGAFQLVLGLATSSHDALRPNNHWGLLQALSGVLPVFVILMVLLTALREVVAAMLGNGGADRIRKWVTRPILIALSLLLAAPLVVPLATSPTLAGSGVVNFVIVFEQLATVLALLAAVSALVVAERTRQSALPADIPEIERFESGVLAAVFAGFLTIWSHDPITLLVCAGAGWIVFRRFVAHAIPAGLTTDQDAGLARRLVEYQRQHQLIEARRKAIEDQYAKGVTDAKALEAERAALTDAEQVAQGKLGYDPALAKRMVLTAGPDNDRLRNGLRGAFAGLGFAAILQIAPFLRAGITAQSSTTLQLLADALLTRTAYDPIVLRYTQVRAVAVPNPALLAALMSLVEACTLWAILGFLFGFGFSRIKGGDGFSRSLRLAFAIAGIFLLSELLSGVQGPLAGWTSFSPVLIFLVVLGIFVFDARTLQSRGVAMAELPSLYGMRRTFGYASIVGLATAAQPIIGFVAKLFTKSGA